MGEGRKDKNVLNNFLKTTVLGAHRGLGGVQSEWYQGKYHVRPGSGGEERFVVKEKKESWGGLVVLNRTMKMGQTTLKIVVCSDRSGETGK